MDAFPADDPHFEDTIVTNAEPFEGGGWAIGLGSGWSLCVPADSPVEPKAGMGARLYSEGIGYTVRGLFLDGVRVFYQTKEEEEADFARRLKEREQAERYDFEKARVSLDRRYAALPEVFRRQLDRLRKSSPDFRWKYEAYELFVCEQAVVIAGAFADLKGDPEALLASMEGFRALDWEAQKAFVPDLDDGRSGNTFEAALCRAYLYLTEPEAVAGAMGALAPLVGSEEYGCVSRA